MSVVKLLLAVVGIDVNPTVTLWSVSEDSDDDSDDDYLLHTPLLMAIMHGHEKVVEMLLAHPHINVNQADETGRTPLIVAIMNGLIIILRAPWTDTIYSTIRKMPCAISSPFFLKTCFDPHTS